MTRSRTQIAAERLIERAISLADVAPTDEHGWSLARESILRAAENYAATLGRSVTVVREARPLVQCVDCGRTRAHAAHGRCDPCYRASRRVA